MAAAPPRLTTPTITAAMRTLAAGLPRPLIAPAVPKPGTPAVSPPLPATAICRPTTRARPSVGLVPRRFGVRQSAVRPTRSPSPTMALKVVTMAAAPPRPTTPTTVAAVETRAASTPPRGGASATSPTPRIRTSVGARPPSTHRNRRRRRASRSPLPTTASPDGLGSTSSSCLKTRRTRLRPSSRPSSICRTITAALEVRAAGLLHRPLPPAPAVPKSGIPAAPRPLPANATRSTIRARASVDLGLRQWTGI